MNRRLLLTPFLSFFFLCGALAQAPVAMIKASPVAGCAPLAVGFNDVSSGNPTSWSWNFGGAPPTVNPGTSTNPNAGVIYTVPGTYFVTLTVSNASGTNTSAPFKITVFPSPTADFDADKLTGCFPTTVHFTDKSSPGIGGATMVSWSWSYGDGNVDPNTQNPSHTYTQGGSFPVTLYVTNNYGCVGKANVKTGAIVLSTGVIPNYNTTLANSCQVPVDATFTNSTTGPGTVTYNWDFGDGGTSTQTSPIHPFSAAGNYNVKLTATSDQGCSDTVTTVVKIASSANVSSFTTAASVCINAPATFTNTSTPFPNSSSWNYGDGSPIDNVRDGLHTYNTAGPYTVTLNNDFSNCNGSVSQTIQVVGPPTAAFIGTSVAGCKPPLTASFTDQSTGATSWLWDFGDGSAKSTLQNPTHTYNAYGSYNVTLTASSAGGCSNSITKNAFVNIIKPIVSIPSLPAYGCAPYTFNPSISVTQAEGIASYHWDFGNGTTFDGATPPPQVYGTGSFPVTLTITTNGGCTASTSGTVKVGSIQPVSDFTASPLTACVNTPIQFTDKSTGGANQWFWDFGDGNSSTLQNPANSFQKPGTFIVKLTAYNDGCYQPTPKTVNITINNPLADFSYSFDCTNSNNFSFKDGSTGPLTWAWDFGDGGTSAAQNPTHSFTPGAPTTFNVSLTVTNGACQSSITKSVTANQVTAISVSANPICKNNTVLINTTHPNNIVSYLFDFGDGTTANSSSGATSHTYTIAKDYQVTVKTTDNTGCSATSAPYTMHITGPTAKFSTPVQQGCNNFSPTFTDLSSFTAGIPITTWAWDFGDGGVSNQQSPTHNYTTEGIFSVKLKVTDANGCTDSVVYPSYITFSAPKASFTTTGTDFGTCSNIKFTNTSQGLFNPVYTWDFKDGSTFIGKDPPLHNFPAVGQYPVTLSITDALGCSAAPFVMAVPINIDTPNASFTMSANYSSCPPLTDHFTFTGHYAQSYRWDLGNGVFSVLQNPSFTYPVPGDWDVSLIVTSPGGCLAKSASQHIHIDGPVGVFLYSPTSACDSLDVNFEVKTGNAVQFTWIFGDNSLPVTDTVPTITHHYNQPGQYIPVVTMEDASGCKVATTGNQTIFIDAIIGTSFTIDKPLICDNSDGKITFTDNSSLARGTVINNYFWDFGDGSTQSGMLPTVTHIFTGVQTYNVTLTFTTVNGCGDSKTLPVQVVS
ncbi:MAG: PKD domain-containing protein, partial [Bacteroidota bacterium]|nr:PKD domain-containing protein [Bacteroidota bacterium]